MTYVSETSLTAIWHNIIQDIYIRLFLTYFFTKNFIWDIWKFGRLSFWPLTKRSIGTQILFFMNAHLKLRAYLIIKKENIIQEEKDMFKEILPQTF